MAGKQPAQGGCDGHGIFDGSVDDPALGSGLEAVRHDGVDAVGFFQFDRFDRSRADVHTDQWFGFSQHPTLEFE